MLQPHPSSPMQKQVFVIHLMSSSAILHYRCLFYAFVPFPNFWFYIFLLNQCILVPTPQKTFHSLFLILPLSNVGISFKFPQKKKKKKSLQPRVNLDSHGHLKSSSHSFQALLCSFLLFLSHGLAMNLQLLGCNVLHAANWVDEKTHQQIFAVFENIWGQLRTRERKRAEISFIRTAVTLLDFRLISTARYCISPRAKAFEFSRTLILPHPSFLLA